MKKVNCIALILPLKKEVVECFGGESNACFSVGKERTMFIFLYYATIFPLSFPQFFSCTRA